MQWSRGSGGGLKVQGKGLRSLILIRRLVLLLLLLVVVVVVLVLPAVAQAAAIVPLLHLHVAGSTIFKATTRSDVTVATVPATTRSDIVAATVAATTCSDIAAATAAAIRHSGIAAATVAATTCTNIAAATVPATRHGDIAAATVAATTCTNIAAATVPATTCSDIAVATLAATAAAARVAAAARAASPSATLPPAASVQEVPAVASAAVTAARAVVIIGLVVIVVAIVLVVVVVVPLLRVVLKSVTRGNISRVTCLVGEGASSPSHRTGKVRGIEAATGSCFALQAPVVLIIDVIGGAVVVVLVVVIVEAIVVVLVATVPTVGATRIVDRPPSPPSPSLSPSPSLPPPAAAAATGGAGGRGGGGGATCANSTTTTLPSVDEVDSTVILTEATTSSEPFPPSFRKVEEDERLQAPAHNEEVPSGIGRGVSPHPTATTDRYDTETEEIFRVPVLAVQRETERGGRGSTLSALLQVVLESSRQTHAQVKCTTTNSSSCNSTISNCSRLNRGSTTHCNSNNVFENVVSSPLSSQAHTSAIAATATATASATTTSNIIIDMKQQSHDQPQQQPQLQVKQQHLQEQQQQQQQQQQQKQQQKRQQKQQQELQQQQKQQDQPQQQLQQQVKRQQQQKQRQQEKRQQEQQQHQQLQQQQEQVRRENSLNTTNVMTVQESVGGSPAACGELSSYETHRKSPVERGGGSSSSCSSSITERRQRTPCSKSAGTTDVETCEAFDEYLIMSRKNVNVDDKETGEEEEEMVEEVEEDPYDMKPPTKKDRGRRSASLNRETREACDENNGHADVSFIVRILRQLLLLPPEKEMHGLPIRPGHCVFMLLSAAELLPYSRYGFKESHLGAAPTHDLEVYVHGVREIQQTAAALLKTQTSSADGFAAHFATSQPSHETSPPPYANTAAAATAAASTAAAVAANQPHASPATAHAAQPAAEVAEAEEAAEAGRGETLAADIASIGTAAETAPATTTPPATTPTATAPAATAPAATAPAATAPAATTPAATAATTPAATAPAATAPAATTPAAATAATTPAATAPAAPAHVPAGRASRGGGAVVQSGSNLDSSSWGSRQQSTRDNLMRLFQPTTPLVLHAVGGSSQQNGQGYMERLATSRETTGCRDTGTNAFPGKAAHLHISTPEDPTSPVHNAYVSDTAAANNAAANTAGANTAAAGPPSSVVRAGAIVEGLSRLAARCRRKGSLVERSTATDGGGGVASGRTPAGGDAPLVGSSSPEKRLSSRDTSAATEASSVSLVATHSGGGGRWPYTVLATTVEAIMGPFFSAIDAAATELLNRIMPWTYITDAHSRLLLAERAVAATKLMRKSRAAVADAIAAKEKRQTEERAANQTNQGATTTEALKDEYEAESIWLEPFCLFEEEEEYPQQQNAAETEPRTHQRTKKDSGDLLAMGPPSLRQDEQHRETMKHHYHHYDHHDYPHQQHHHHYQQQEQQEQQSSIEYDEQSTKEEEEKKKKKNRDDAQMSQEQQQKIVGDNQRGVNKERIQSPRDRPTIPRAFSERRTTCPHACAYLVEVCSEPRGRSFAPIYMELPFYFNIRLSYYPWGIAPVAWTILCSVITALLLTCVTMWALYIRPLSQLRNNNKKKRQKQQQQHCEDLVSDSLNAPDSAAVSPAIHSHKAGDLTTASLLSPRSNGGSIASDQSRSAPVAPHPPPPATATTTTNGVIAHNHPTNAPVSAPTAAVEARNHPSTPSPIAATAAATTAPATTTSTAAATATATATATAAPAAAPTAAPTTAATTTAATVRSPPPALVPIQSSSTSSVCLTFADARAEAANSPFLEMAPRLWGVPLSPLWAIEYLLLLSHVVMRHVMHRCRRYILILLPRQFTRPFFRSYRDSRTP